MTSLPCFEPEMVVVGAQDWIDPDGCIGTTTQVFLDAGSGACCDGQ